MINWSTHAAVASKDARHACENAADRIVVNLADKSAALAEIETRLRQRQGFTLATLNLDHVVKLRLDPAFRRAYALHDFVTADGNPIVWLSRLAGHRIALVPGSELVKPVVELAVRHNLSVAMFGATEEALSAAADRLELAYPGLRIVARIAPPMGFDPDGELADAAIAELRDTGARVCFLALGAPKQELFATRAAQRMPGTGFFSIGAGLDFLGGTQKRAPKVVRALAGEWLWRLAGNPRRLSARYGACIRILPGLVIEALRRRVAQERDAT
jgi:exopolysaccharide biosynthesis WecB/TagA/CpsF family protein